MIGSAITSTQAALWIVIGAPLGVIAMITVFFRASQASYVVTPRAHTRRVVLPHAADVAHAASGTPETAAAESDLRSTASTAALGLVPPARRTQEHLHVQY